MNEIRISPSAKTPDIKFSTPSSNSIDITPIKISSYASELSYWNTNQDTEELDLSEYANDDALIIQLKSYGLNDTDINRVLNNEITIEDLIVEIQNDEEKYRKVLEASYLAQFNMGFNSIEELENASKDLTEQLKKIRTEQKDSNLDLILDIVEQLKNNKSLESIEKQIYTYKWVDSNGDTYYKDFAPTGDVMVDGITCTSYSAITYGELLQDNKYYQQLCSTLNEVTVNPLFGDSYTEHKWANSENQLEYLDKLENTKDIQAQQLAELEEKKQIYDYIIECTSREVDHQLNNIAPYIYKEDFNINCNYNKDNANKLFAITDITSFELTEENGLYENKNYSGIYSSNSSGYISLEINDNQEALIAILNGLINEDGTVIDQNGILTLPNNDSISISSSDDLLANYRQWIPLMSDTEKQIFNYIYNTEGYEKAYNYLQDIASELDNRWLANKMQEDQEYASAHPWLASAYSVVATPAEGLKAVVNSVGALIEGEEIRRTNVYSSGDVYRQQVSSDIDDKYGHIASFWYNTGMSMADSAMNTALVLGTGGAGVFISAGTMGSRVYVSTLNDALDRGLSDMDAVALSFASAATETAMESYSIGHLLNMEEILASKAAPYAAKIAEKISDPTTAKIASNIFLVAYGAVSQGICEGEEEVSTEILNYLCDDIISGDLSSYNLTIKNYLDLGYSEEEALNMASDGLLEQFKQAFLGGFASGITFGTIGAGATQTNNYIQRRTAAKELAASITTDYQTKGIEQAQEAVSTLTSQSTATTMLDIKKALLGGVASFPAYFNKFRTESLSSNQSLIAKVANEGLVHITTEEAASKIIESGYVKASGNVLTSYGTPKAFFFSGIPSFGEVCLNLNTFREKAVAVRIKPSVETLNDGTFSYRAHDDYAITHKGNFNFENGSAEIVYLGLDVNENGEFYYKEISQEEYVNYTPDTASITRNAPKIIKSLSDSVKGMMFGLSYQYDVLIKGIEQLKSEKIDIASKSNDSNVCSPSNVSMDDTKKTNLTFQHHEEELKSLEILHGKSAQEIFDYLKDHSENMDELFKTVEVQDFFKKYFSANVTAFTVRIINNLSAETITLELMKQIMDLNDEQFTQFVKQSANNTLYENDEIFNRAIATGINFIFGLSPTIQLKMIQNDHYINSIKDDSYTCNSVARNIPSEYLEQFLNRIDFNSKDVSTRMKILDGVQLSENMQTSILNNEEYISYLSEIAESDNWSFSRFVSYLSEEKIELLMEKISLSTKSPSNKMKIFLGIIEKISSDSQRKIIEKNKILDSISLIYSSDLQKFLSEIKDPEFLYEIYSNEAVFEKLRNSGVIYTMISYLASEYQYQLIESKNMLANLSIKNFNEMIISLKAEAIEKLLSNNPNLIQYVDANSLLDMYVKTNSENYLQKLKEMLAKGNITSFDNLRRFIIENNVESLFTMEEFQLIYKDATLSQILEFLDKINDEEYKNYLEKLIDEKINSNSNWELSELVKVIEKLTQEQINNIIPQINYISIYYLKQIFDKLTPIQLNMFFDKMGVVKLLDDIEEEKVFQYVIKRLKENSSLLNDVEVSELSWRLYSDMSVAEKVNEIISLIDPVDRLKFVSEITLKNEQFKNETIQSLLQNSSLITNISDKVVNKFLTCFTFEQKVELYKKMSAKSLAAVFSSELSREEKTLIQDLIVSKFNELNAAEQTNILRNLNEEDQVALLSKISLFKYSSVYFDNLLKYVKSDMVLSIVFKKMFTDDNVANISDFEIRSILLSMDEKTLNLFIKNCSDSIIIRFFSIYSTPSLENEIMERFKKNEKIFAEKNGNLAIECLSDKSKQDLSNYINRNLLQMNYSGIFDLLNDAQLSQKITFLYACHDGLIDNQKIEILINLKEKNRSVLSTFNYQLFDETIYKFGEKFLTKLSKYPSIVDQLFELKKYPQKFNLFANLIIYDNEANPLVADSKMAILLNYILANDIETRLLNSTTIEELDVVRNILLKEIDQFSICDWFGNEIKRTRSLISIDEYTLENYYEQYNSMCDDLLQYATTVEEVQNLIFNKYFSMAYEDAVEMFRMYGSRFENIVDFDETGIATTYLENLHNILNLSSMEDATNFYKNFTSQYTMDENLIVINEIKKAYTRSLKSTLFDPTDVTGYITYEGKQIPLYEPQGDFQMLIQSTHAYGKGLPMINNNYFDSWNLSERTSNHGICCSLISNNNMGMAKVDGTGVIIGFNSFSDEQINMMAPYDIYTANDGYVITCSRPLLYLPGTEIMNQTRHTHNEFNLERADLTGQSELANIQPDYVVVFEEMSDDLKQNAYKASIEFDVPLVYISKKSLAIKESTKIDNMIAKFKSSGDLSTLKEILLLHENNRSGYRVSDPELVKTYFPTDKIQNLLYDTIHRATTPEQLNYIREFLKEELEKFDITHEATGRANSIDIAVGDMIELIEKKIEILPILNNNSTFNIPISTTNEDGTNKQISVVDVLRLVCNTDIFIDFNFNETFTDTTKHLVSNYTKAEFYEGVIGFVSILNQNNLKFNLSEIQYKRLIKIYEDGLKLFGLNNQ